MTMRVGSIGTYVLERSARGSLRRALVGLALIAVLLLYVAGKVMIMRLGYRIEALQKDQQRLERANRELRIEAAYLSSPSRIEAIARKRLGMIRPSGKDVVIVRRKQPAHPQ